jgi:hypothetical protein
MCSGLAPEAADGVQTELKRHLLVRTHPIEQRNRRAKRLEVQVTDRVYELSQKLGDRLLVDVRLAGDSGLPLNLLIGCQLEIVRNVPQVP